MEHHLQIGVGKMYILDDGSQASRLPWAQLMLHRMCLVGSAA